MNVEVIVIYLDVYFFINLALDYISLYISGAVFGYRTTFHRLFLSSVSLASLSLILFFCKSALLSFLILLPFSYLFTYIATGRREAKVVLFFIFTELFLGGVIESVGGIIQSGNTILAPSLAVAVLIPCFFIIQKKAKKSLECESVSALVEIDSMRGKLVLLVDSGNLATEPITNRRIIFVGKCAWDRFFSKKALSDSVKSFDVFLKTASGSTTLKAYQPDRISFECKKYNSEKFLVLPSPTCRDFAGFDGIVPLIK